MGTISLKNGKQLSQTIKNWLWKRLGFASVKERHRQTCLEAIQPLKSNYHPEHGYFLTLGNYRLCEPFEKEDDMFRYAMEKPYEVILNLSETAARIVIDKKETNK